MSAVFYMYAPYRSVDVWVRGALPEAAAFVFYPIIFYNLDQYLVTRAQKHLWYLVLFLALLVTTHNLSFIMFAPFLGLWCIIHWARTRDFSA